MTTMSARLSYQHRKDTHYFAKNKESQVTQKDLFKKNMIKQSVI